MSCEGVYEALRKRLDDLLLDFHVENLAKFDFLVFLSLILGTDPGVYFFSQKSVIITLKIAW